MAASAAVAALAAGLLGGWAATPTAAPLQQPCCLPRGCHLGISLRSLIFHISFHICHVFFVQVVASFVDMFKLWSSVSFCHVVFVLCCRLHVYMDDGNSICDHDLMFCFAFSDSKKLKTLRDPPPSERCIYTVFFFFFSMAPSKKSNKMPRAVQATVEDASYASGELWPSPANSSVAWLAGESPPLLAASSAVPPPPWPAASSAVPPPLLPAASSAVPPPLSPAASLAVPPPLSLADSPPPLPPPPLGPEAEDLLDAAADKELEWPVHYYTMLQDRCH